MWNDGTLCVCVFLLTLYGLIDWLISGCWHTAQLFVISKTDSLVCIERYTYYLHILSYKVYRGEQHMCSVALTVKSQLCQLDDTCQTHRERRNSYVVLITSSLSPWADSVTIVLHVQCFLQTWSHCCVSNVSYWHHVFVEFSSGARHAFIKQYSSLQNLSIINSKESTFNYMI